MVDNVGLPCGILLRSSTQPTLVLVFSLNASVLGYQIVYIFGEKECGDALGQRDEAQSYFASLQGFQVTHN
ncbi:hypothetical protein [Nostoc sp.]